MYAAVALTVWLGGTRPAILASVVGFLLSDWLFLTRGAIGGASVNWVITFLAYVITCGLIIGMGFARDVVLARLERERARLQRSEDFHHAIADLAADFAWTARVEPDGRIVTEEVTEGFRKHLGYALDELMAAGGWDVLIHPDERPRAADAMARALRGETVRGEIRQLTRDGREIRVAYVTRPVMNAHGRVVRLYGGSRDVTDQHRSAEALRWALDEARVTRERLEEAMTSLRESEERFRGIADSAPVLMWLNDEGGASFVNRAYLEYVGAGDEAKVRGWDWTTYVHPDDRERYVGAYHACSRRQEPFDAEFRFRRHDGEYRWMRSVGVVRRSPSGAFLGYVGCTYEIHEARVATAAVRESERRLSTILQTMPAPVYLLDREHRIVHVNRQYEEHVGESMSTLVGRRLDEVFPPDVAAAFMDNNERVIAERRPMEFEERARTSHGDRVFTTVKAPLFDERGEPAGIAGVSVDVTDRTRAEEMLARNETRLTLLWDAAGVLLTADDPDAMLHGLFERIGGHIGADAYLNYVLDDTGRALRLASQRGLTPEQAGSIPVLDFGQAVCGTVALEKKPCVASYIQESDDPKVGIVKGFGMRAYACNPLLVGDELLGTLSFASRTRDAFGDDELEFLRIISRYVTAAFERLRLIARLREADTRKDQFLATLAHELRNPLAPIRNMLEVLGRADDDAAMRAHARATMGRQVDQMVRLVDDLLDVSRITRNRLELRREQTDLATVLQQAVETSRPLVDAQGHELTLELPPETIRLDADPVRLAQVFANLLNNACKYTAPGGHLRVSAEREGSDVVVRVRDDGIGIPREMLPRIFDVFTQVDRSIERSQGGLGIGLTLVRQLVEMHGGSVEARSEGQGKGSTFVVRLPALVERPAASPSAPPGASFASGPARRILVVDDYHDSADSLSIFLRFVGHETLVAHDGLEALEAAERHRPDVILLDIGLPRLNGLDACRRLREQPWGREMVVIALTGWGQEEDRRRSQEAGFDGHLVKPVNYRELAQMLANLPSPTAAR